jgi:tetratricopeptide (TPR) repeat protein
MKRPRTLVVTVIALATIGYTLQQRFAHLQSEMVDRSERISAVEKTTPVATKPGGLPQGLFEPRIKADETIAAPAAASVSQGCLDYMADMQRMNLEPLKFPPEPLALPKASSCRALPDGQLAKLSKNAQKECAALSKDVAAGKIAADKEQWSKQSFGCLFNMILLRSTIAAWQSRDQKLSDITDQKLLTDRLLAAFGSFMGQNKPDPTTLIATSERLMEVNPHSYEGMKGALIGHSVAAMTDQTYLSDETRVRRLQELANSAARLRPEDDGHQVIQDIIATRGYNPQAALPVMTAAVERNPNDPRAHWGLAWALYKTGAGVERALPHLEQALALDPSNQNYRETLQRLRAPNPGPDAFRNSVSLGMSLDNLF